MTLGSPAQGGEPRHFGMLMGGVVVHDQIQLLGLPPERSNPNFSPSLPRWRAGPMLPSRPASAADTALAPADG